jgi:hypothetical protein
MTPEPEDLESKVKGQFAEDLSKIYRADVSIPATIDQAILNRARTHFRQRRSRQLVLRIGSLITAAAALIVIVVHLRTNEPSSNSAPVAVQTHHVDIVDALKLARRVRAAQTDPTRDDINHDGAVDQRDIDAIAMAAVRLPEARVQ